MCGAVAPTSAFNINIGSWNTARATTMGGMFYEAVAFNQDISSWNVASVTTFTGGSGWGMFNGASAFNQNLASWNVLRVTSFTANFDSTTGLSSCNKGAIYTAWGATFQAAWPTLNYACTVGSVACAMCITNGNVGAAVTAWVTDATAAAMTYGDIAEWSTSAVTSLASVFASKPTFNADIGKWNVASVANMASAFSGAAAMTPTAVPSVSGSSGLSSACFGATSLTSSSGTISDGPGSYGHYVQCSWLIQTGAAVTLTFSAFATEVGYDFVKVYSGSTASAPLLGSFSGTSTPGAVTSSTGTMLVSFSTDGSVKNSGFVASYSSYARPTFNSDISKWNVASVSTMASTFSGASALNQNLASWNVLRVNAAGFATMWGNFPPTLPQAHTHSRL